MVIEEAGLKVSIRDKERNLILRGIVFKPRTSLYLRPCLFYAKRLPVSAHLVRLPMFPWRAQVKTATPLLIYILTSEIVVAYVIGRISFPFVDDGGPKISVETACPFGFNDDLELAPNLQA